VAGLQLVIPLMTPALLQFPKLGRRYFALLAVLMDVYPAQVQLYTHMPAPASNPLLWPPWKECCRRHAHMPAAPPSGRYPSAFAVEARDGPSVGVGGVRCPLGVNVLVLRVLHWKGGCGQWEVTSGERRGTLCMRDVKR